MTLEEKLMRIYNEATVELELKYQELTQEADDAEG
jgi:hypothetical protein